MVELIEVEMKVRIDVEGEEEEVWLVVGRSVRLFWESD